MTLQAADIGGVEAPARMSARLRRVRWPVVAAILFLLACLPFVGTTLDDWDGFNFALGVRDYDPALHQPHPPGYPLYTGLAKISTGALDALWPERATNAAGQRNAALGLAIWSVLAGTLSLLVLPWLFSGLMRAGGNADGGDDRRTVFGATVLTVTCPLFWITSLRPLSDMPGLVLALAVQALILGAISERSGSAAATRLVISSLLAGLSIGVRSQIMWLTLPLLAAAIVTRWRTLSWRDLALAPLAFVLGALAWAVPMVVATGGLDQYLRALGAQGAQDFAGVDMLYRSPDKVRLARGLEHTFVWPWVSASLAAVLSCLAALGGIRLLVKAPRAIALGLVAFAPYAAFHLLFQETMTTRYALPLVPAVAWAAAHGAGLLSRRSALPLTIVAAFAATAVAWPSVAEYAAAGSPVGRLSAEMGDRAAAMGARPSIGMHHEMRRAVQWTLGGPPAAANLLLCTPGDEVPCALRSLEQGNTPVWFVGNPRRGDLELMDLRELRRYSWSLPVSRLLGNPRPAQAAWYEMSAPGWFVKEGWALNPQIGGMSTKLGRGPSLSPIEARIRRRDGPAVAMIGGRHVGAQSSGPALVAIDLDGRRLETIEATPDVRFFLRRIDLPGGALAGAGRFAALTVSATGGGPVAIEQFDVQDVDRVVFGFADGWHELEYSVATASNWRWASERATLLVHNGGRDVEVEVRGESPLRYFDKATKVALVAGSARLGEAQASDDFTFRVVVPMEALDRSGGTLTLESSQYFTPAERGESADARRLALRIYEVSVRSR